MNASAYITYGIFNGKRNSEAIARYQSLQWDLIWARRELLETITKYDGAIVEYAPRIARLKTTLLEATAVGREAICDLSAQIKIRNDQNANMASVIVFPQELVVGGFLPHAAPKIERSELLRANGKYGLADFSDIEGYLRIYGLYYVNNFQFFLEREKEALSKIIDRIDQMLKIFSIPLKLFWPIAQIKIVRQYFGSIEAEEFNSKSRQMDGIFNQRVKRIETDIAELNELAARLSRFELNGK